MKILNLRFKNLNSLHGEWNIDFTAPEYISDGIFAITGPTGAGKTTILDAICLAIYGQTPRLKSISQSTNEIMSRQTGDCYAEVVFETLSGKFLCHWQQRKARGKVDGNLRIPRHEISEIRPNRETVLIENMLSKIDGEVGRITGMDFQRFTRSMLLAQGGFDAFLKANANERAPILEQITGTEIYSNISKMVYEKQKEEKEKLDRLKYDLEAITTLSEQDELDIKENLAGKEEESVTYSKKNEQLTSCVNRLENIKKLKNEITLLDEELTRVSQDLEKAEPLRNKLEKANKAAELEPLYVTLTRIREQLNKYRDELKTKNELLPKLKTTLSDKERLLQDGFSQLEEIKEKRNKELILIRKVRDIDSRISEKEKGYQEAVAEHKKRAKELKTNKNRKKEIVDTIAGMQEELKQYKDYLIANEFDENLVTSFEIISERTRYLQMSMQEQSKKKEKFADLQFEAKRAGVYLEKQQDILKRLQTAVSKHSMQIDDKQKQYSELLQGKLLREYRSEKDTLLREKSYIKKIESLEEERRNLQDGKPCPLCGSEHHPYADGNIPHIDETEAIILKITKLIEAAENIEAEINDLKEERDRINREVNKVDREAASAVIKKDAAIENRNSFETEYQKFSEELEKKRSNLVSLLKPFGFDDIVEDKLEKLISNLEKRLNQWLKVNEKNSVLVKKIERLEAEIDGLDTVITSLEKSVMEKEQSLTKNKEVLEILKEERLNIYGTKKPDEEEILLGDAVTTAEKSIEAHRKLRDDAYNKLNEVTIRVTDLNKTITNCISELEGFEEEFVRGSIRIGFKDENEFVSARLTKQEREDIGRKIKELEEKLTNIETRKKDREEKLIIESNQVTDSTPLEVLKEEQLSLQQILKRLSEEIGALKKELEDNEKKRNVYKEKLTARDEQEKEYYKWDKLNLLIGSADGKKFRNFAQGITFEIMISNANKQLAKMSDRYLLICDEKEPLELNIIDSYQAGDLRSTKNLSGGESFIVSLSLALGLSYMASKKVRVDSLFLDEGFGTLDEEALETALESLAGLHHEGKVIGIISHVPALKERISTQINVTPVSDGRSKLSGPGCSVPNNTVA